MNQRRGAWLWLFCALAVSWSCDPNAPDTTSPGTGPGVRACGVEGVLLCDDFEGASVGGVPDASKWQVQIFEQKGRISIDGTQARSGSKSVYVNGTGSGSYRSVLFSTTAPFPPQHNSFYARVFLRSKNGMGQGHSTYFGGGSADNQRMVRIGFHQYVLEANLIHPGTEYEVLSGPWGQPSQGVQLQAGRWHCVEAFFNGAQHELRVWFDGSEVAGLRTTNWGKNLSTWSPQYGRAWFGFETYHSEQDELWYDDIIIGTQRIGCGG
ncbi:MAG TPA: hypothetical protein VEU33_33900 [Archangium sp.]|nr:hypothetical protein [Archangium sp.]